MAQPDAPANALGDDEYDPKEHPPKSAKPWLNQITAAEKAFADYDARCDNIEKQYADLARLANVGRDREFQLFWSNIQVLGPSIYSRPPVPVVAPKFKDRRPLYRVSSELLERSSVVAFDLAKIDRIMRQVRDDLMIVGRGTPWVRYETRAESEYATERVCVETKDRKDFLHEPARKWDDVGWVAGAAYLTKKEARKRFRKYSGNAYSNCTYAVQKDDKDNGAADSREKAKIWELWSKTENKVVWVADGCDVVLEEADPHLKLESFFPCPEPAYGTLQRRTLVPVPDFMFYKDQIEEINELTGRIHALSQALQVRGFYPAGQSELGTAIEKAIAENDNRKVLIPISNWAAFGNGSAKDTIVWLPIDMVATTVVQCVELRRQLIDDVYQIVGISDVMRGATESEETLGAQQLKMQSGSVRIRDKQSELVRVARDTLAIMAEIMAEKFEAQTLLDMSQMEIPTDAEIARQVEAVAQKAEQQLAQAMQQAQASGQQVDPQQVQQQIVQQAAPEIEKLQKTPTVEKIMAFLRDQKTRPFVLDIETDSTIQLDEQAEKQSRTEFLGMLGQSLGQLGELVAAEPKAAGFAAEVLKFAMAPFRAGRELEGKLEEFADAMASRAGQEKPNPEAEKAKAELAMKDKELQGKMQIEQMKMKADAEARAQEQQFKAQENQAKMAQISAQMERDERKGQLEERKLQMEIAAKERELQIKQESAQIDAAAKAQQAQISTASAQQQAEIKAQQADQSMQHSEAAFRQKSELTAQQAAMKEQANGA